MSSTIAIDFILPWTQSTATSLQTVFDATWTSADADDVIVYARGTGVAADDATQLISSADYAVTFVGSDEDVRVTFSVGRTLDDIVTLTRKTPTSRLNLYSNTNFAPSMLNGDFNKLVMMLQERVLENLILPDAASASTRLSPKYNNSESLTYPNDAILPILTAGGIWRKNDGNTAIEESTIPADPVGSDAAFTNDNRMVKTDTSGTYNNVQQTGVTIDDSDNLTGLASMVVASLTYPTSDGTAGQVMGTNGAGALTFTNAGDGDVDGPASATDNAVARFSATTGKLIQNSGVIIDDSDNMTGAASININSTIAIVGTIDDDTMATATATNISTSEATKAYVDSTAAGTGDVDGPASSTDNAIARYDSTTGKLLQDSSVLVSDADAITGITSLTVDNLIMNGNDLTSGAGVVAITPLSGQDLNIVVDSGGEVNLTGAMLFNHTATENDDRALEIDCDAAGFSDVKAIDIDYITGPIAATEEEASILVNIDESASTGGDITGIEILSTAEGSADIYGVSGFVNVNPVLQSSGTFGDIDQILINASDDTAAINAGSADLDCFLLDDDTMTFLDDNKFEELEIILSRGASGAGISPTFEYSNSSGPTTFTPFGPVDGTNGWRNSGAIAWLVGDLPGWVVGDSGDYEVRVTRTRNTVTTTPKIDKAQLAATTEYLWDKDGALNVKTVTVDADPTTNLMLATKQYVDDATLGLEFKDSVVATSTAALTVTYDNGASGVGATLTNAAAMAAFTLDGVSPSAADRVLIKDQASTFQNGIYTVTTVGDGSTNWVLTRATDHDEPDKMTSGVFVVTDAGGTANALSSWVQTSTVVTVGTTAVTFSQFTYGTTYPNLTVTTNLTLTALTASRAVVTDGSKVLASATTTATELDYVNGVTSAIQTQLDAKISQSGAQIFAADSVGSDSYAITLSPVPAGYTTGMLVNFTAGTANTGPCTLDVNSLGAISIKKNHDIDPEDNDIESGSVVTVVYDGTNFQMISQVAGQATAAVEAITSSTTAGAASMDFNNLGSYDNILIIGSSILPVSNAVNLLFRTSTDNGVGYDAGASDYSWAFETILHNTTPTTTQVGDNADAGINLYQGQGNVSTETADFSLWLLNPAGTAYTSAYWTGKTSNAVTNELRVSGSGTRLSSADVDAFQFKFNTGNIIGTIKVWGFRTF